MHLCPACWALLLTGGLLQAAPVRFAWMGAPGGGSALGEALGPQYRVREHTSEDASGKGRALTAFRPGAILAEPGPGDLEAWRQDRAAFVETWVRKVRGWQALPGRPRVFLAKPHAAGTNVDPILMRGDLLEVARRTDVPCLDRGPASLAAQVRGWLEPGFRVQGPWGDGMVFQHGVATPLEGRARPGTALEVRFDGRTVARTRADAWGRWQSFLPAVPASDTPHVLEVRSGRERMKAENLLAGELFLCAGQSNMVWTVRQSGERPREGERWEDPMVRVYHVRYGEPAPGWKAAQGEVVDQTSAVAWHLARELRSRTGRPIGLVVAAHGGAPTESFLPEASILARASLADLLGPEKWTDHPSLNRWVKEQLLQAPEGTPHPFAPTVLHDRLIAPLGALPLRAVVWYQGESNASTLAEPDQPTSPGRNAVLLETLFRGWRAQFRQPSLPIFQVQLPSMGRAWMEYRRMQERLSRRLPNVHLAGILDLGDPKNVHPSRKREVGERLARLVDWHCLGWRGGVPTGPKLERWERGPGGEVLLDFASVGEGLRSDGPLKGFELGDAKGIFAQVEAEVVGPARVKLKGGDAAVRMRYAWAPVPEATLVNAEGLPAYPFEEVLENPGVSPVVSTRPWWQARHEKVLRAVAERRYDLLLVGDSITHQWGGLPEVQASEGCKPYGQEAWDRHFASRNTLNLGFSGDRTQNVLWRLEHGELEGQRPRGAVVMIGTNNSAGPVCTPEQTAEGVLAICRTLRQRCPGVNILLVGVLPRFRSDPGYDAYPGQVNTYLAPQAAREGLGWLDLESTFAEPDGRLRPGLFYDGLHLSEAGYRTWGEALEPHLKRLLGER